MNPLDLVKKYPIPAFAAGIVVVGGVILLSGGGGGGGGSPAIATQTVDANMVAANNALNQMQIQASTQNNQIAAALQAKKEDNATAIALATLQGTYSTTNNQLAAEIERLRIQNETATQQQYNTLQAKNAEQQYQLQRDIESTRAATTIEMQRIMSDIVNRQTDAQVRITEITKPKRGWISKIFG